MVKRMWMALALIVMLWSQGCTQQDRTPAMSNDSKVVEFNKATVLEVPAHQMRQNVEDLYRLKLDRRFTLAFGEIHYFLRGGKGEVVDLDWANNKWQIKVGGREAGQVPEQVGFEEILEHLSAWARNLTPSYSFHRESKDSDHLKRIRTQAGYFLPPYLFTGLRVADKLWSKKEGDLEALKASAEMLARLYFQTPDLLEESDILGAKALALFTILRVFARDPITAEEALVAYKMGYEKHAQTLAQSLPEDDPIRFYITRSDDKLRAHALEESGATLTRFLWLSRLAEMGDLGGWDVFRKQFFDFNAAIVSVNGTGFEKLPYKPIYVQTSLGSLLDTIDPQGVQQRGTASMKEVAEKLDGKRLDEGQYKTLVANMNQYSNGPFLDKRTFSSYANSALQSNLFYMAKNELQKLYISGQGEFRLSYLDAASGEFSKSLGAWHSEVYRQYAKKQKDFSDILMKSPLAFTGFRSAFFVYRLAQFQGVPLNLGALRTISNQLDSRPQHLFFMTEVAQDGLYDSALNRELTRRIGLYQEISTEQNLLMLRDEEKIADLFAVAEDQSRDWKLRLMAARLIFGYERPNLLRLREVYRALIKSHGDQWEVREAYLDFLEKGDLLKAAEIIIRDYLKGRDSSAGFDYLRAKVAMARLYQKQSRSEDALKELEGLYTARAREIAKSYIKSLGNFEYDDLDLKPSYALKRNFDRQNYIVRRQAAVEAIARPITLFLDHGKIEEAEKIAADFASEFESHIEFRALRARVHWAKKQWGEAARLINLHPIPIRDREWQEWVVRSYLDQNSKLNSNDAELAFLSMGREKFPVDRLIDLGRQLPTPPPGWAQLQAGKKDGTNLWQEYLNRKEKEGPESALSWFSEQVPRDKRNSFSLEIFGSNEDELLWTFIENPEDGGQAEYVWLLRAASHLRTQSKNASRLSALKHFYSHEGSSHYFSIGRHLMGFISEQQALALAVGGNEKCELAYFLGLKAEVDKNWPLALDWYRVAIETELVENSEYNWAKSRLLKQINQANNFLIPERYVSAAAKN